MDHLNENMKSKGKLIDLTEYKIKSLIENLRPPKEIRDQVDIGYSFDGKELILFEVRPFWDDPQQVHKLPFACTRFIKSKGIWKVYWLRASGKWNLYDPVPKVMDVEKFFAIVNEDEYACFRG